MILPTIPPRLESGRHVLIVRHPGNLLRKSPRSEHWPVALLQSWARSLLPVEAELLEVPVAMKSLQLQDAEGTFTPQPDDPMVVRLVVYLPGFTAEELGL